MSEPYKFILATDSTYDMGNEFAKENDILLNDLTYTIGGNTYNDEEGNALAIHEFYDRLRNKENATTSQINPDKYREFFVEQLKHGQDILYINFSSALSGCYNSARVAAEELNNTSENKIYVIDSKSASCGQGLYVTYAVVLRNMGKTAEEVADIIVKERDTFLHYFTVNDLFFLHRGGRVSKTAAIVGSMLGVKPVLHVDEEGRLIPIAKARGRKNSLVQLVDYMDKKTNHGEIENKLVYISHGDCPEDADFVANLVKQRYKFVEKIIINNVGPVIGCHSGPGTVALFFRGVNRAENK